MKKLLFIVILLSSMAISSYLAISLLRSPERGTKSRTQPIPAALSKKDIVNEIENRIMIERPYDFGEIMEVVLPLDQGIRLKCPENPIGLQEFLICPMANGFIYTYRIDENGDIGGGGNKLTPSGRSRRGGDRAQREYTKWKVEGNQVRIRFQAKYNEDFGRKAENLFQKLNSKQINDTQFDVQYSELVREYNMEPDL